MVALLAAIPGQLPGESVEEMNARVVQLLDGGKYREAAELAGKQLELARARAEEDPGALAGSLHNLGEAYRRMGRREKAEPLLLEAREVRAKVAGADDLDYARTLNSLAALYDAQGAYEKAERLYLQVKEIRAKRLGKKDPAYADILCNLAGLYDTLGKPGKAEPLYLEARGIKAKVAPDGDPGTGTILNNLGNLYELLGSYDKAEKCHLEALQVRAKILGKEHPDYAQSLCNLAGLYRVTGRYRESERLFLEAKETRARMLGKDHRDYSLTLTRLATLYQEMGEYGKSESSYLEGRAIQARVLGEDHPDYAGTLNNLAQLYQEMGLYEKAEPLFQQAIAILTKKLGADHPDCAAPLSNLAALCLAMGAHDKAESLFLKAEAIDVKVLGREHANHASDLNNLAAVYVAKGDYAKAEPLYLQANEILAKALGEGHPYCAANLINLAELYHATGRLEEAEPLYRRGAGSLAEVVGEEHPDHAATLNNLAALYQGMGAFGKAEPLFQKAREIRAKVLGKDHPDYAASLGGLASLYQARGEPARAVPLAREVTRIRRHMLDRAFGAFPEKDRESYVLSLHLHDLPCSTGDGPLVADSAISFKGAVCASLLEERRLLAAATEPEAAALVERLEMLRRQFQRITLRGDHAQAEQVFAEAEEVEKRLARSVTGLGGARRSLQTRTADVQQVLPPRAALVEFLRYRRPVAGDRKRQAWEPRYGAVVIRHDREPVFVGLAAAAVIDDAVQRMRARALAAPAEDGDEGMRAVAGELYQLLLGPLEAALGDAGTLVVCPDSQLHFLPFEPLLDPGGRMACEKWAIRMIDTGRDLLEQPEHAADRRLALLVGDPAFGAEGRVPAGSDAQLADNRGIFVVDNNLKLGMQADVAGMSFASLPGTRAEAGALDEVLKARGWETQILAGPEASESGLRSRFHGQKLVHLATHGFFLNRLEVAGLDGPDGLRPVGESRPPRPVQDPMFRSGLALAGANRTMAAWQQGEVPEPSNDGLLTAAEAVTLNLAGTELVVLSACETAKGKALDGEGIYGLRRALKLAGADTVVMTLWTVSDAYTAGFMKDFYGRYLQGRHPVIALAETKREHLVRLRKEAGLQKAIRLAGPFIAAGRGVAAVESAPLTTGP